jgi:hypothetical protein
VVLDNASGIGSGSLDVAVAPNTGAARSGTVTVAGQAVEIDQAAGDSTICTYGLSPGSATIPAAGATGSIAVTTGSQCSYYVVPFPQDSDTVTGVQFITIPQTSSLLVGDGSPSYTVAANHGAPRSGAIMVGGDVFTLTQDAPSCYYTLSTISATEPVGGGTGTIGVTPSSPSCAWTAESSNTSVLSVTAGASGTGNGTVSYSVPVNAEGPQTATITIGDANGYTVFTENQTSAFTCTFTISPLSVEVTSNGVSNFFGITASYNFCKWTAVSSDPSSLTIGDVTGAAGLSTTGSATGSGAIYYRVAQNATGAPRILTITAGCQTFTVNQDGAAASNPVPAITTLLPASTTAGSGAFTLTVNGSSFVNGAVVNFNGNARTTTYVSANQVTAAILASDIANAGTPAVTVTNPGPGGGVSNALTFSITAAASNPVPAITTLQPASTTAGSGAFTLTVNGSSFVNGAVVNFNGNARTTTYVSATQVTAAILASDVANVGIPAVTVTNPAPGGGTSNALTFSITAASVVTATLTPATLSFTSATGVATAAQIATLSNTGNAAISITGITVAGTNPSDFAQTNNCGESLAANTSCSISITFTPASSGSFAATLSVADNASASPQTTSLSGTGTAAPSFTISSSVSSQTVQPGGTAQYSMTVTAQNGTFSNPVTLAASGLPPGATATFSPSSITPGSSSATSQLSIQTASAMAAVNAKATRWPLALPAMALIGLFFLPRKHRRRWITMAVLLFASLGALAALSGCGGGFGLSGTGAATTYNITVTGTSGAVQQTTTVQLTVQ